ncbi:MAG: DNA mismatch repair endonuclease MutL [Acidobacteriota bacterium]|nr:DNA mismatch repair endonuclease MutL [Blastocatellia bacterium]MDW8413531.1 DNA mismatch repair endonuclease MutL [Acidobacteriota bacterium]
MMPKIRILPDTLANKIAAGEVVERPSSVVKELLENALDAGATKIRVDTEAGGKKLIRVADNGEGMSKEDAVLAFERHATSKLHDIDELENITTLGFRGEALPSIASVARVTLKTALEQDVEGTEVRIEGGRVVHVVSLAWPRGTEVEVSDLFFNVPARRKFLKGESTENYHICNLVTNYALANPHVSFVLRSAGREIVSTTPVSSLKERAYQLFGADFVETLVQIDEEVGFVSIRGFVSKPDVQRASREAQYLFVNGRYVRDRVIARAISEAYKNVLPPDAHPCVMLMLEVPGNEVDVNVHPAKTEVRFRRPQLIHEAVCNAIRDCLAASRPFATFPAEKVVSTSISASGNLPQVDLISSAGVASDASQTFGLSKPVDAPVLLQLPDVEDPFQATTCSKQLLALQAERPRASDAPKTFTNMAALAKTDEATVCSSLTLDYDEQIVGGIRPLGQLRSSFIVAEDEQGLVLIDQHVAHERILFEQQLAKMKAGKLEVQQLLVPDTFELTPAQAVAFEMIEPALEKSGFHTMRLSGRTVALQAIPQLLSVAEARRLVLDLIAVQSEGEAVSLEDFQREIAAGMACRAAIKINTPLNEEKMRWLIDSLMATECPTNCPHGRPIVLRLSMRDIKRGFKR